MPTPTLVFNPATQISTAVNFTVLDAAATVTDGGNVLNAIQILLGAGLGTLGISSGGLLTTSGTIGLINYQYDAGRKLLTLRDNTGGQTALGADFTTALRLVGYDRGAGGENATQTISTSIGNPVYSSITGHYYEFINGTIDWPSSNTAANAKTFLGLTGYLATVTSAAETTFLSTFFSSNGWSGGTSAGTAAGTTGSNRIWKWSAGPESGVTFWTGSAVAGQYANWNSGEPNNGGQPASTTNLEPYLVLLGGSFSWADASGTTSGYYTEYSTVSGTGADGLAGTRQSATFTVVSPFPAILQTITPIQVAQLNGVVTSTIGVTAGNVTVGASNATHIQVTIDLGTNNAGKRRQPQGLRVINGSERELISSRTRVGEAYNFVFLKTVDGSNSVILLLN